MPVVGRGLFDTAMRRSIVVIPVMLVVMWLAISITASTVLARSNPDLAIRLYPANSRALERGATIASVAPGIASAERASKLARRSLAASPLSSEGAIALAVARTIIRPQDDAMAAVEYSQFLSRRTTFAQIWLIEHGAQQGNIGVALKAYDRLFRVSDYYRGQFLPILLTASAQPDVARGIARLLATRPPWRGEYFGGLLGHFPGADNFALLIRAMRFDPADADGARRLTLALTKLVDAGRPDLAFSVYRMAMGRRGDAAALVRNGDFATADGIVPFAWQLNQSDELSAEIGINPAGRSALQLRNRGGRVGAFARQLVLLRPGAYRLGFVVGSVQGADIDRPKMIVQCVGVATELAAVTFPEAPEDGRSVAASLSVPAQGCSAQWLTVQAGNPVDGIAAEQWLSAVRLTALGDARPASVR